MGQTLPMHLGSAGSNQMLDSFFVPSNPQPQEEVDPRKLCILGLPWDTTEEMLHSYFAQFGSLEVCIPYSL